MRKIVLLAATAAAALTAAAAANVTLSTEAEPGQAPVARTREVNTYQNIAVTGQLTAMDPEGESLCFRLVQNGKKGTAELTEEGFFRYTPAQGKTGRDQFTFTATDESGNVSAEATVTVQIQRQKSHVLYYDMEGESAHAAAIALADSGVFIGTQVGDGYYFSPDSEVSRMEFLAMAMTMAGMETLENVLMTGFTDDAAIPTWGKSYASKEMKNGVIQGVSTEKGVFFSPHSTITTWEAATVLNRILKVADVALPQEELPEWAGQAVANMESVQVVSAGSFDYAQGSRGITRAEAAEMLSTAMQVLENQRKGKSFFDWLW